MTEDMVEYGRIQQAILLIRSQKVILDRDLAALYGVETKTLKRAVTRNAERFPSDFMFVLNSQKVATLRYQFGTLKRGEHAKYPPIRQLMTPPDPPPRKIGFHVREARSKYKVAGNHERKCEK
jgi:hypothetical protein